MAGESTLGSRAEHRCPLLAWAQAELESASEQLGDLERSVVVLGSARLARGDAEYELAHAVGARLGREGFAIITGGGPGIMEAANRGARDVSARSIGLVTEPSVEWVNPYLDLQLRFHYFSTRKLVFVRCAVAFVIFPGGFGTLDELFELAALIQTGRVSSRPIVLVGRDFWAPLIAWLRGSALGEGKIDAGDLELFAVADDKDEVLAYVRGS